MKAANCPIPRVSAPVISALTSKLRAVSNRACATANPEIAETLHYEGLRRFAQLAEFYGAKRTELSTELPRLHLATADCPSVTVKSVLGVRQDGNGLPVQFDLLLPNDGLVFAVIHEVHGLVF